MMAFDFDYGWISSIGLTFFAANIFAHISPLATAEKSAEISGLKLT